MKMHNPAHPGEILAGWLEDLKTSVTAFAGHLGISRVMLSRVLNGHAAVSADMDLRLSEALGTNPGYRLALQVQSDLWKATERAKSARPLGACLCRRAWQPIDAQWTEILIDLLPDGLAKTCDVVALNLPKVWLGCIQNLDAPCHGC